MHTAMKCIRTMCSLVFTDYFTVAHSLGRSSTHCVIDLNLIIYFGIKQSGTKSDGCKPKLDLIIFAFLASTVRLPPPGLLYRGWKRIVKS